VPATIEHNKEVVTSFFGRMNVGDVAGAFGLLTDEVAWFSLSTRKFSSRENMLAAINWVNAEVLQAPIVQTVTVLTAEDNRVAALCEGHAVTVGGVRYDQAYHFLFEFDGDRIGRLWEFNDTFHARAVFALDAAGKLPSAD
jgi:ketosteroid isomerase-like protein